MRCHWTGTELSSLIYLVKIYIFFSFWVSASSGIYPVKKYMLPQNILTFYLIVFARGQGVFRVCGEKNAAVKRPIIGISC